MRIISKKKFIIRTPSATVVTQGSNLIQDIPENCKDNPTFKLAVKEGLIQVLESQASSKRDKKGD